jgi:hypothetical protein
VTKQLAGELSRDRLGPELRKRRPSQLLVDGREAQSTESSRIDEAQLSSVAHPDDEVGVIVSTIGRRTDENTPRHSKMDQQGVIPLALPTHRPQQVLAATKHTTGDHAPHASNMLILPPPMRSRA